MRRFHRNPTGYPAAMAERGAVRRRLAAVIAVCALSLVGCADGDDDAPAPITPEESPADTPRETPTTPPPATGGGDAAGVPPPGSCADLPEAADGRYTVGDAGTAVVRRDGDRLVVEEVAPSSGWTYDVTEHGDDEVEVDFRRGGEERELEVEIDDGRVEVQLCVDDRDDGGWDDNDDDHHRHRRGDDHHDDDSDNGDNNDDDDDDDNDD